MVAKKVEYLAELTVEFHAKNGKIFLPGKTLPVFCDKSSGFDKKGNFFMKRWYSDGSDLKIPAKHFK